MKHVLLEIPDKKAKRLLDVLLHISYVKTTILPDVKDTAPKTSNGKARLVKEIQNAVKDLNEIKAGKKQARSADEFLAEL